MIAEGGLEFGAAGLEVIQIAIGGEEVGGFAGGDGGDPRVVFLMETQAERGVAGDEIAEGAVQGFGI